MLAYKRTCTCTHGSAYSGTHSRVACNLTYYCTEHRTSAGTYQCTVACVVAATEHQCGTKGAIVEEKLKTAYTVLSDYYGEKDDAVYDYPMPEKGALLCYHYLQETINYYTKQGKAADAVDGTIYAFQVVIDLYGDIETAEGTRYEDLYYTEKGHALIEQEYRRLIDLGYAVRLSEDFQLTGTFTKTEIDTFQAAPEYGYVFRFEGES